MKEIGARTAAAKEEDGQARWAEDTQIRYRKTT